jgi:acetyl-CoA carboxylase biotin carboxylase subunit
MLEAALRVAEVFDYSNAGTAEFLVSGEEFFFIEFNARLQVEHPVTELTTGIDLVVAQFQVAAGMPLPWKQSDITSRGHAIEFRLCAEDPMKFLPSPGRIQRLEFPLGIRVDSGYAQGNLVTPYYDSLLAKMTVHAPSRAQALEKARCALRECRVEGIKTNLPLHQQILEDADFQAGRLTTRFLEGFSKRVAAVAPQKEKGL